MFLEIRHTHSTCHVSEELKLKVRAYLERLFIIYVKLLSVAQIASCPVLGLSVYNELEMLCRII
jgi:hypothetical protein